MRNWDHIIDNYIRVCETRGLTESVILGRRRELERFGTWLKRRKPKPAVEEISSELILDYIKGRTAFHSKSSVCGVMSHIRCLGEYLVNEGIWNQNPLRWIQSPKIDPRRQLPRRVDKENLRKLIAETTKISQPHNRSLYFTLLLVLYGTGMRRGELERLNLKDWDREHGSLRIDSQKVNLQRVVPVPAAVAAAIESYLPVRQNTLLELGIREEEALFVTAKGKRILGDRIGVRVHKLAQRAEVPLVTLHQFRHTCASDLLEEGLGLHEVQRYLGHAYLATTIRYTHIADPARKQAVALHPINQILASLAGDQDFNSQSGREERFCG